MKKTLLKFSSTMYLIAFRKFSKAQHWEINLTDLTVICDCSDKEARIALRDFKAVMMEPVQERDRQIITNDMGYLAAAHSIAS
jgi:hypothetical protein